MPIVTVDSPRVLREAAAASADQAACYLVHEIGAGHWFGYLWGRHVASFLDLAQGARRISSCLHADTLEELTEVLGSPPLEVSREALGRIGLILFMQISRGAQGDRRRVSRFYQADGQGGHALRFAWDAAEDRFEQVGDLPDPGSLAAYRDFLARLAADGDPEPASVRRRVVQFYRTCGTLDSK